LLLDELVGLGWNGSSSPESEVYRPEAAWCLEKPNVPVDVLLCCPEALQLLL